MNDQLEIDFSEVTDIDTAALSLIMEWQRNALASKCTISFVNLPANLNSLAELYGVTSFISVTKP
jgi:phospholipid transport system transporter-binding protein